MSSKSGVCILHFQPWNPKYSTASPWLALSVLDNEGKWLEARRCIKIQFLNRTDDWWRVKARVAALRRGRDRSQFRGYLTNGTDRKSNGSDIVGEAVEKIKYLRFGIWYRGSCRGLGLAIKTMSWFALLSWRQFRFFTNNKWITEAKILEVLT